jgi:hypothetical protein
VGGVVGQSEGVRNCPENRSGKPTEELLAPERQHRAPHLPHTGPSPHTGDLGDAKGNDHARSIDRSCTRRGGRGGVA